MRGPCNPRRTPRVEYLTARRRSSPAPPGASAAPRRALLAEQDARLLINDLDGDFAEAHLVDVVVAVAVRVAG
jgi:hypothetical protein